MREYSDELAACVKAYLESQEWRYEFVEERGIFRFGLNIACKMKSIHMLIGISEEGFMASAISPISPDEGMRDKAAEFIARANYGLRYGCFEMDYSDGEISYKNALFCGEDIPSQSVVEHTVDLPFFMWKKYGDAFLSMIFGGLSPEEAVAMAEGEKESD